MNSFVRLIVPAALAALLVATTTVSAFAWSMGGHRVTAIVAARDLAVTAPHVIDAVAAIMQAHPAAAEFDERMGETGVDHVARLERLFAEIAQWPDEIRRGPLKQFHRGAWHTIDIPYFARGFRPAVEPAITAENMLWALRENARIAADAAANPADRAIALCWVFHLIGDMHQPLHAINLISETFPSGDRFGSQFWVRPQTGEEPVNLHYFWDSLIVRSQKTPEVERVAGQLMAAHPRADLQEMRALPYRGPDSFERWTLDESHRLAVSAGYREGRLAGAADKREAPHLGEDYVAVARGIAARRMALAGYRLAEVLRTIFP